MRYKLLSAKWCHNCPAAKTYMNEKFGEGGYELVDVDESSELVLELGVRGIPTLVGDNGGELCIVASGVEKIKKHLDTLVNI